MTVDLAPWSQGRSCTVDNSYHPHQDPVGTAVELRLMSPQYFWRQPQTTGLGGLWPLVQAVDSLETGHLEGQAPEPVVLHTLCFSNLEAEL